MGDDAACAGLRLAGDSATCSCGGGECGGERPALCGVAPRVVSRARARCGLRLRCSEGIEIESRSATAVAMAEGVEGSRSSGEATRRSALLGAVWMRPSSHAARARSCAGELGRTAAGALCCRRESTSARSRRASRSAARSSSRSAAASMARRCSASRAEAAWPERERKGGGESRVTPPRCRCEMHMQTCILAEVCPHEM